MGKAATITDIKLQGSEKKLVLSGDGRADSPGHSAKYGSYTVLEMTCNKVVGPGVHQLALVLVMSTPINSFASLTLMFTHNYYRRSVFNCVV